MKKIGELLKQEREKKGLSLHEIGMSLKINPKVLKAIEDGNPDGMPAKTFLRGFIRSYAQYLRLDVDQVLKMFQDEVGTTRPEEPKISSTGSEQPPSSQNITSAPQPPLAKTVMEPRVSSDGPSIASMITTPRVYTVIGAVVLLLLIVFVVEMMNKYEKEAQVPENPAIEAADASTTTVPFETTTTLEGQQMMTVAPTSTTTLLVSTTVPLVTTTSTTLKPTTTLATTTTTVKPTTTTTLKPTTTTTTVKATTTTTTVKVTTTTVKPTTTTTTLKPTTTTTTQAKSTTTTLATATSTTLAKVAPIEVIVEATDPVTIRYSFNGGKTESIEIGKDQVHTFKTRGKIQMEINDGGAINLIVNGRERKAPGSKGQALKLNFP